MIATITSLSLVADTIEAWAETAQRNADSTHTHDQSYKRAEQNKFDNYSAQVKRIRACRDDVYFAIRWAIKELSDIHAHHHPECKDKGPCTCSTWAVIHHLKGAINE